MPGTLLSAEIDMALILSLVHIELIIPHTKHIIVQG